MDVFDQITNVYSSVVAIFENYGWYILIAAIALIYIYNKALKDKLQKFKEQQFEREYAAKYHKNPDLLNARQTAQQEWVAKMQEKLQKESEQHLQKLKEKEERKRQELLEKYGDISGKRLGNASDKSSEESKASTSFKPEYNPLMGGGSSTNYRAPKRSCCNKGGGCGR